MQLVRGGSDRRLQNAALLQVLPLLAGSKLISGDDIAELTEAYLVLRKAENALQMMRDQQTHTLPEDPQDRARLAMVMGFKDWRRNVCRVSMRRSRRWRRNSMHCCSARRMRSAATPRSGWRGWTRTMRRSKRNWPTAAFRALKLRQLPRFSSPIGRRRIIGASMRPVTGACMSFWPGCSKRAAAHASPATVVQRVLRVLEAIGSRASYLALLKEQPAALDRLIEVCAISGFLSRQIADFPLLLDELIDAKAFDELPTRAEFTQELAARTERLSPDDPERQVEALRQFQKVAVFTVALADLTGRLPLMRVSDRLTDIADRARSRPRGGGTCGGVVAPPLRR